MQYSNSHSNELSKEVFNFDLVYLKGKAEANKWKLIDKHFKAQKIFYQQIN
ncbi:MAG: hypothetical protein N2490_05765 [Ignavibacteria bacterium]|nr:hypothetical protein [Ignavibacteria bacterium]